MSDLIKNIIDKYNISSEDAEELLIDFDRKVSTGIRKAFLSRLVNDKAVIIDIDGNILDYTLEAGLFSGILKKLVKNANIFNFVSPEYHDSFKTILADMEIDDVEFFSFDISLPIRRLHKVNLCINCIEINKRKEYLLSVLRLDKEFNITPAFEVDKRMLGAFFELSPMGISVRKKSGTLILYNKAWQEIWGFKDEDIENFMLPRERLQLDTKDAYLGKDVEKVLKVYNKGGVYSTGVLKVPGIGKATYVSQTFYAVTNNYGEVDYVVILTEDVSESRIVDVELRESEKLYRNLVDSSPDGIVITDLKANIIKMNNKAEEILDIKNKEELKEKLKHPIKFIHKDDRSNAFRRLNDLIVHGNIEDVRYRIIQPDGGYKTINVNATVIKGKSFLPKYIQAVVNDITPILDKENEIKKSIDNLNKAQKIAKIGTWELNTSTKEFTYSEEFLKILGLDKEDVIGIENYMDYIHPEDLEYFENAVKKSIENNQPYMAEYRIFNPLLGIRIIFEQADTNSNEKGETVFSGILQDITNRKTIESELYLKESERKAILRSLQDSAVFIFDQEGAVIDTYIDPRLHKKYKLGESERIEKSMLRLDDEGKLPELESITQTGVRFRQEYYIVINDNLYWHNLSLVPIFDDRGAVSKVVGFVRDITDYKNIQTELSEANEKYEYLISNIPSYIWTFVDDLKGMSYSTFYSPVVEKVTGYTAEEMVKFPELRSQMAHPDDVEYLKKIRRRLIKDLGKSIEYDFRIFHKNGKLTWLHQIATAEKEGNRIRFNGITTDITDKKNLEVKLQRAERMQAMGQLAGGVAHDLNNILTGIVAYPDLILMSLDENSPIREYVLMIQKSGLLARDIVQDLLTLARRAVVTKKPAVPAKIVRNLLQSPEIKKVHNDHPMIELISDIRDENSQILAAKHQIYKALMNLIFNSFEAISGKGKIKVSVITRNLTEVYNGYEMIEPGSYVIFEVSDNGTGIPEEYQKNIFEPFYTKKMNAVKGTGLGLAIVWGVVKDSNGFIDLTSSSGTGTIISLWFPVVQQKVKEDEIIPVDLPMGDGQKILIVDDMESQRTIASDILKKLKYTPITVNSGEDALEFLKTNNPDLILLDMVMEPGMDGLETFKRVQKMKPEQKVLIITGFAQNFHINEATRLGVLGCVRKPYTINTLAYNIHNALNGKATN